MECVVQTQLGLMCIINVPGNLCNCTLFVTNRSVIVIPYNNHIRMALEWEMAGQYSFASSKFVTSAKTRLRQGTVLKAALAAVPGWLLLSRLSIRRQINTDRI